MAYGIEFYDNIGTLTGSTARVPRVVDVFTAAANTTYTRNIPGFNTRDGFVVHLGNTTSSSNQFTFDTFDYSFSGTTLIINTNSCAGSFIIGYGS